jgi:hypothetical protein
MGVCVDQLYYQPVKFRAVLDSVSGLRLFQLNKFFDVRFLRKIRDSEQWLAISGGDQKGPATFNEQLWIRIPTRDGWRSVADSDSNRE